MTLAEAKAQLLSNLEGWLEEPGNTTKFIVELANAMTPQGPAKMFIVRAEATVAQLVVHAPQPSIVVPHGMPPNMPPPPNGNGR